jgi:hypothetical protein
MNMRARNVAWLLPFFLSACFHFHKNQTQQDQLFAPPLANLPRPPLEHPDLPEEALTIPAQPLATESDMEQEDVPPARRRKPAKPAAQQSATPSAAPEESTGVSAIGTLSTGEPSDMRGDINDSIAGTERGLNGLGRNLNAQEQKTAAQIRSYLKQAREALVSADMDGASTLAAKARVLLNELRR